MPVRERRFAAVVRSCAAALEEADSPLPATDIESARGLTRLGTEAARSCLDVDGSRWLR